jgi:hypothetical protein
MCLLNLHRLERFGQIGEADEEALPPDWPEIERRGRERFYSYLESRTKKEQPQTPKKSFWAKVRAMIAHPALAYLLVLALLYPAYRGFFQKPEIRVVREKETVEVPKPPLDMAALRTFELKAPERAGGQGPSVVRVSPDEPFFALTFFVPISERPELVYDVEIRDSQNHVVAEQKDARATDRLGNFLFVCRRELFLPGQYLLRVREVNRTMGAATIQAIFPFTVSEMK